MRRVEREERGGGVGPPTNPCRAELHNRTNRRLWNLQVSPSPRCQQRLDLPCNFCQLVGEDCSLSLSLCRTLFHSISISISPSLQLSRTIRVLYQYTTPLVCTFLSLFCHVSGFLGTASISPPPPSEPALLRIRIRLWSGSGYDPDPVMIQIRLWSRSEYDPDPVKIRNQLWSGSSYDPVPIMILIRLWSGTSYDPDPVLILIRLWYWSGYDPDPVIIRIQLWSVTVL